ncbi:MAG: tyrosine-type recombinase/integrase [Chloroflexi bacterium]|nr:tyrosine-type recombinase/integrase [Chloroflexota bacterium]
MSKDQSPPLGELLQNFFYQRLQAQQQVSPHTLASYRDTLRLLLCFVEQKTGRTPSQQTLPDWNAETILRFLDHVEKGRGCQARTRNVRLATVRAFMRYVAQQVPEALVLTNRVLAIPMKRFDRPLVTPLSTAEVEAILQATDPTTASGRRDHLLFNLLYHTGARVSEALALQLQDILWGPPSVIRLHGKGRKERAIPLLKPIAGELKQALAQNSSEPAALIFQNRFGQRLSRSGVEKRLRRAVQLAAQHCPALKTRAVSPHTFRHTTAMRLLEADVDIMVIALLLGHESPTTTHHYIELDMQMKERCLGKLQSPKTKTSRFKPGDRLLQFLEAL